jgi:gamma-glutamyltranspeptidase/glutathione hydrolase
MQNTINILDFKIPIDESVNRPRFGGSYYVPGNMVEADFNPKVVAEAGKKGVQLTTVNPWNWHHGAFEGVYVDQSTGTMIARGDPRRCSKAEGV